MYVTMADGLKKTNLGKRLCEVIACNVIHHRIVIYYYYRSVYSGNDAYSISAMEWEGVHRIHILIICNAARWLTNHYDTLLTKRLTPRAPDLQAYTSILVLLVAVYILGVNACVHLTIDWKRMLFKRGKAIRDLSSATRLLVGHALYIITNRYLMTWPVRQTCGTSLISRQSRDRHSPRTHSTHPPQLDSPRTAPGVQQTNFRSGLYDEV